MTQSESPVHDSLGSHRGSRGECMQRSNHADATGTEHWSRAYHELAASSREVDHHHTSTRKPVPYWRKAEAISVSQLRVLHANEPHVAFITVLSAWASTFVLIGSPLPVWYNSRPFMTFPMMMLRSPLSPPGAAGSP